MRSLAQWLTYLESIHPNSIDMGLNRIKAVADNLGLHFSDKTVITVAGTNGKGTTCRFLELACQTQHKTTGVYSSPHLLDYRERVRINGESPDEAAFCQAFEQIERIRADVTLTYFEFSTLAALLLMQRFKVEVLILEVGLGGRLDATNIIDPDLAVITTIDLDHQDWLGDTREAIAREKAGIMRCHGLAVIGETDPPVSLQDEVEKRQVNARWAGQDFTFTQNGLWSWQGRAARFSNLPTPHIPIQNVSTALAALECLNWLPSQSDLDALLKSASMPGRMQIIRTEPQVVIDVGHNPQAVRAMQSWLDKQTFDQLHLVAGMLKDKSIAATLNAFRPGDTRWYFGSTHGPRGAAAQTLYDQLDISQQPQASCYNTVTSAYQHAFAEANDNDLILVFGSFLTVADVLILEADTNAL